LIDPPEGKRERFSSRGLRSVNPVTGLSSPLLCAPACRPAHLLDCSASPRLAACPAARSARCRLVWLPSCLLWGTTRLRLAAARGTTRLLSPAPESLRHWACTPSAAPPVPVCLLGAPPTAWWHPSRVERVTLRPTITPRSVWELKTLHTNTNTNDRISYRKPTAGTFATRSGAPNATQRNQHSAGYRSRICLNKRRNTN
jgi:hypothetical protein